MADPTTRTQLTLEEYVEEAKTTLRAFSCDTELAVQWQRRLDLYRSAGMDAGTAITKLLEANGYLGDD